MQKLMESPLGALCVTAENGALTRIDFVEHGFPIDESGSSQDRVLLDEAIRQLSEYFPGNRSAFDLPLAPRGTPFQRAVWDALLSIPYGQTRAYRDIATHIGAPNACRAVGGANGRNPLPIVIPCHRVVAASGLGGYSAGLERKKALLRIEGILI